MREPSECSRQRSISFGLHLRTLESFPSSFLSSLYTVCSFQVFCVRAFGMLSVRCSDLLFLLLQLVIQTWSFGPPMAASSNISQTESMSSTNITQSSLIRRKPIYQNEYIHCRPGRLPSWLRQTLRILTNEPFANYRNAYDICSIDSHQTRTAGCNCVDPDQGQIECRKGDADPAIFNSDEVVEYCQDRCYCGLPILRSRTRSRPMVTVEDLIRDPTDFSLSYVLVEASP